MGSLEAGGCLDTQLRVHGIDSLRVCDASIFPEQLSGHPVRVMSADVLENELTWLQQMMPLVAIAERFADELKVNL